MPLLSGRDQGTTVASSARQSKASGIGRMSLREIDAGMHYSIIGTCVSDDDLVRLIARSGLKVASDTPSHELH